MRIFLLAVIKKQPDLTLDEVVDRMRAANIAGRPQCGELAKRLDEDVELLKDEFEDFIGGEEDSDTGDIEPWPELTRALLSEVRAQFRRYVIVHNDAGQVAIVLWIFLAWVHDKVAVHSPYLVLTSPEGDSGKTTACGVIQQLTPRSYPAAELTGPNLYRFVDHLHPNPGAAPPYAREVACIWSNSCFQTTNVFSDTKIAIDASRLRPVKNKT